MAMLNNQRVDKNATNLAQSSGEFFFFFGGTFQTKLAMKPDQDGREHTKENEDVTFFLFKSVEYHPKKNIIIYQYLFPFLDPEHQLPMTNVYPFDKMSTYFHTNSISRKCTRARCVCV